MTMDRRTTTATDAVGNVVVGLSLCWLISPALSLSVSPNSIGIGFHFHHSRPPNHRHRHRIILTHRQQIDIGRPIIAPPPSSWRQPSRNHRHHCAFFSTLHEDERGEIEFTVTEADDEVESNIIDGNNVAAFNSYDTMLLDTMMDSDEIAVDDDDKADKYADDVNMEQREYDNESPSRYPSIVSHAPSSVPSSFESSSSEISNNSIQGNDGNLIINSSSGGGGSSSSSSSRERRPSNRRMQVFAYLSKPVVEVRIIGLVLLSCFLQAITTLDSLPPYLYGAIEHVDTICVIIFATEFFARWWSAGRLQLRYLARPLVCIDAIVVILPLFLNGLLPLWDFGVVTGFFPPVNLPSWLLAASSANSALLNLRLLRILKFQRVLTDETTYMNFELALGMKKSDVRPYQLQLARVVISIFTLVSVSTGLIYSAEHEVNPQIPDYFTALYFGLTTLTTVGFGDISPVTVSGRFVVGASILAGVAIIPAQAANLAEAYLDFMKERAAASSSSSPGMSRAKRSTSTTTANATGRIKDVTTASSSTTEIMRKEANYCSACGAGSHRDDARFCWSCGKTLE